MFFRLVLAAGLALSNLVQGQVVGKPDGFATGTTGGGSAKAAAPANIAQLKQWLTDEVPRVILIEKEFNFIGSEGKKTETGCRPPSNTCGKSGQDSINGGSNWCDSSYPKVSVTYDLAAMNPIQVASHKSIVGVGNKGIIKGKGLRLTNGASNIIIQNVHITNLNPQYIWGGDAITLDSTDRVWIDHVTFSLIGRQFLVSGYRQAGRVTISNCDLNGQTSWSSSCNNDHYWTMLFLGANDQITFKNNLIRNTSGRSPKVGTTGKVTMHALNNYWLNTGGHAFEVKKGGSVLMEGNVFENVVTPITAETATAGGVVFNVPNSAAANTCKSYLGRACQANSLSKSGVFPSYNNVQALATYKGLATVPNAMSTSSVAAYVKANAGYGRIKAARRRTITI